MQFNKVIIKTVGYNNVGMQFYINNELITSIKSDNNEIVVKFDKTYEYSNLCVEIKSLTSELYIESITLLNEEQKRLIMFLDDWYCADTYITMAINIEN